jgi:hypothetical protein
VPPTRGVFKGSSAVRSELSVAVRVGASTTSLLDQPHMPWVSREVSSPLLSAEHGQQQQQQQQQ